MSDLEFTLQLPPEGNGDEVAVYIEACRAKIVSALEQLSPRIRKSWPTSEKIQCRILLYDSTTNRPSLRAYLRPTIEAVSMLWNAKSSMPLVMIEQFVLIDNELASSRVVVKITRRKLISENGLGKHYEW